MKYIACAGRTIAAHRFTKYLLMTKLAILLICAFSVQSFAHGYGQGINLNLDRVQLRKVFKTIEAQGVFRFVYKDEILPKGKTISINTTNASLDEVLSQVLRNTPLSYKKLSETLVVITNEDKLDDHDALPPVDVTGRITNAKGEPMAGVSIVEKGTTNGTTTGEDGRFRLTVAGPTSVLVFSSVGFRKTELTVGSRRDFSISLDAAESSSLNDVVVIGYGVRQRKDVTGSISTVSSKDIEKSTSLSPELALQGTAAGVLVQSGGGNPGARPSIRIRGVNTFGNAEPLYVVDGVPIYEGGSGVVGGGIGDIRGNVNIFTLINPDDIESITVLKDASAAAIYGVRASNGVILITTKRGKSGKPRVEVSAQYGIQNIPKKLKLLNTQQYFQVVNEAYANNPAKTAGGAAIPIGQDSTHYGPLYDPTDPLYAGNNPTTDWVDAIVNKNAPMQNHNIRVSGGNEGTTYYFSVGYAKTESPLKSNFLERYSISTNIESRISKIISAGITLRMNQEDALDNTQSSLRDMYTSIPFQPIYDKNNPTGFAPVVSGTFSDNAGYDPTKLNSGAYKNFSFTKLWGNNTRYNPLAFEALNNTSYRLYNLLGNVYVQIEPISGLRVKGTIGGQYVYNLRKTFGDLLTAWQYSQTPGNPYASQDGNAKGTYGERTGMTTNLNKELSVSFNRTIAKDHTIDVLLDASSQFGQWRYSDLSGNVNYTDPQFRSITNQPPYTTGSSGILQEDQLIGYLGRVSYKYKDKYYVDGTIRRDGSSRLAPGHQWDNFPSFAVAWRISSETFFPKVNWINDLKLRGGWGRLGNFLSAGYYQFLSNVSLAPHYSSGSGNGDAYGQQALGAYLPNFANTTLTWEKLKTTNVGFDAVLFNNHINLTAEYFNKETYGIIQSVSLPPNTGIPQPASLNIATVRNRGVEFQVGYTTKFGDVDFNASGNISTINNKVIKLYGGNPFGDNYRVEEGYSINYIRGYKVGGIFQNQGEIDQWRATHADVHIGQKPGDPTVGPAYAPGDMYFQDLNGAPLPGSKKPFSPGPDSVINDYDRVYLGKTIPGYTYGFSVGAAYKGIDINVLFQGVGDVQGYDGLRAELENPGSIGNMSTAVLGRWTPSNPSKSIPRAVAGDPTSATRFSDRYVENAGYVRLKNLTLGYSLPKSILNPIGFIQGFRVYVTAVNLVTITKWKGLDPETDVTGNLGYNPGGPAGVPNTRQFLVGIKANF